MFDGRDIDDLRRSVYSNFYTDADIDIIQETSLPDKRDIKRLMNKADKIGDIETVFALKEVYADILNPPDRGSFYSSLSRAELEAREAIALDKAHKRLIELRKRKTSAGA